MSDRKLRRQRRPIVQNTLVVQQHIHINVFQPVTFPQWLGYSLAGIVLIAFLKH